MSYRISMKEILQHSLWPPPRLIRMVIERIQLLPFSFLKLSFLIKHSIREVAMSCAKKRLFNASQTGRSIQTGVFLFDKKNRMLLPRCLAGVNNNLFFLTCLNPQTLGHTCRKMMNRNLTIISIILAGVTSVCGFNGFFFLRKKNPCR